MIFPPFRALISTAALLLLPAPPAVAQEADDVRPADEPLQLILPEGQGQTVTESSRFAEISVIWGEFYATMARDLEGKAKQDLAAYIADITEATGEPNDAWQDDAVDIEARIAARPGGTAENFLVNAESDTPTLSYYGGFPSGMFDGAWALVGKGPDSEMLLEAQAGSLTALSDRHVLAAPLVEERLGNAYCTFRPIARPDDAVSVFRDFYDEERKLSEKSIRREVEVIGFVAAFGSVPFPAICTIYVEDGEGRFRARYFLPDGRALPKFAEHDEVYEIRSLASVRRELVKGVSPYPLGIDFEKN